MKLFINWKTKQKVITGEIGTTSYYQATTILNDRDFILVGYIQGSFDNFSKDFIILDTYDKVLAFKKKIKPNLNAQISELKKDLVNMQRGI